MFICDDFSFSAQATGDVCGLPQVIGTGPYRIPRWYFNTATGRCELFYYSGCCGNANNYPTFDSCQVLCEGADISLYSPKNISFLLLRHFLGLSLFSLVTNQRQTDFFHSETNCADAIALVRTA